MSITRTATAAAIAAALALAGCGSSGSGDAASAEKTVRTYIHDVIAKNGESACALFTDSWKQQVEDQYAAQMGSTGGTTDCASLIHDLSNGHAVIFEGHAVTDSQVDRLDLKTTVDDNDGSPVATVKGPKGVQEYDLSHSSGSWKITRIGAPPAN